MYINEKGRKDEEREEREAARQGLEERFRVAALFCAFVGMEHRADKCNASLGLWTGEAEADKRRYMSVEEQKGQEQEQELLYKGNWIMLRNPVGAVRRLCRNSIHRFLCSLFGG